MERAVRLQRKLRPFPSSASVATAWILAIFCVAILVTPFFASTDPDDVIALRDLYRTLGHPAQLIGWNSNSGDPCEDSWKGVSCDRTYVVYIKLASLDLSGYIGGQLYLLHLVRLDLSSNHLKGGIPILLLPLIQFIDLSGNEFSGNIPCAFSFMKHLRHLNLSHNVLSGPMDDIFSGFQDLRSMDLSYNSFSGALPNSFENLTHLEVLYLQNNNLSGPLVVLKNIHVTYLNIENNMFLGEVTQQFGDVANARVGAKKKGSLFVGLAIGFATILGVASVVFCFIRRKKLRAFDRVDSMELVPISVSDTVVSDTVVSISEEPEEESSEKPPSPKVGSKRSRNPPRWMKDYVL